MNHWHREDRTKTCSMCGETKPLNEFSAYRYVTNQGKDSTRYESRCRPCNAARRVARYWKDPDGENAKANAWKRQNTEYLSEYSKKRQLDPKHRANKAKSQRLRKARARSGQGDNAAIRAIYAEAMRIEAIVANCPLFDLPELGHKMHVDHVMPLSKGGLHHEDNLQILPAGINMRKGASCPR